MSSIRERAAALKLAEKLSVGPQSTGVCVRSVQLTCLWKDLVSHLRSSLTVKRHRVLLKSHSDCFLGSEVVDELQAFIAGVAEFRGADVSRAALACASQALLDTRVLQSVSTKVFGRDKKEFLDSKSALYRFLDDVPPSVDGQDRGVLEIQKLLRTVPAGRSCPQESSHLSAHLSRGPTPCPAGSHDQPRPQVSPRPVASEETPAEGPGRVQDRPGLSESLVLETWQEQTLLRLLNLVELPLLEGVLQGTHTWSEKNPEVVSGGTGLDRQVLRAFRASQSDVWLCAALDLMDFLPDQSLVKLSRELPSCFPPEREDVGGSGADLSHVKTLTFNLLLKHYGCAERPPLLPRHMTDIYAAVTDLLVQAKADSALEALQLCLKLLPPGCREELCRLLTFMALAADAAEFKLDEEAENRLTVKRCFSRAVLHGRSLSREKEELLLVFMLSNIQDIFKIPAVLHKLVSDKLLNVVQDHHHPPRASGGPRVETFTESTRESTRQELWALLSSIHLNTSRSSKERKRLLGQFYQAHPGIFNQYFGDTSVL